MPVHAWCAEWDRADLPRPVPRQRPGPAFGLARDYLGRHDSVGFDSGLQDVPSCPASLPKVSRGRRLPCLDAPADRANCRLAHPVDSPPSPVHRARGVSVPNASASPGRLQNAVASRKWHLDVGSHKLWPPGPCRIPAGCPVSQSGRNGSRPTAPGRPQTALSVPPAPRRHPRRVFSTLAATTLQAGLAPRHYRTIPCGEPSFDASIDRNLPPDM